MGLLHCTKTQRPQHIVLLLLLLFSSTAHHHSSVEGLDPVPGGSLFRIPDKIASTKKARALIGSRPPICERRCIACGHCEAVQVPVIPQSKKTKTTTAMRRRRQSMGAVASLRGGDYGSNYKPLSWKCKCGDIIFNP